MKTLPDLQQIEILILIVKHGSFRQAARALNLSPPALTSAMEGANKQVISSQADSLIKISRIWADF
ncbi:helix-turn-helix domain-containing protein, partial [Klebsiella quasipneumoniae]|uniref:helix-turn-helix domain-containing protein n=1 Tax=Klebsiella quasipneumoniae TaxID=1463165 RepID=UPI003C2AAE1A